MMDCYKCKHKQGEYCELFDDVLGFEDCIFIEEDEN